MPYIVGEDAPDRGRRGDLDPYIEALSAAMMTPGELNYCISRLAVLYLAPIRKQGKKVGYEQLSQIRAVLQDAADEFYANPVRDYEDKKMEENGDVYAELRDL